MPLYKPEHWERVQWLYDNGNWEDPGLACTGGVPRMGPPDRIIQTPKELFFFYHALRDTYRIIPMNKPLPPVEQWEGLKWARHVLSAMGGRNAGH